MKSGFSSHALIANAGITTTRNELKNYPAALPVIKILEQSAIPELEEALIGLTGACSMDAKNKEKNQGKTLALITDILHLINQQQALTISICREVFDDLRHGNLLPNTLSALQAAEPLTKARIHTLFSNTGRYLHMYRWLAEIDKTGNYFSELLDKALPHFSSFSQSMLLLSYRQPPEWFTLEAWKYLLQADDAETINVARAYENLHKLGILEQFQMQVITEKARRHGMERVLEKPFYKFTAEEIRETFPAPKPEPTLSQKKSDVRTSLDVC